MSTTIYIALQLNQNNNQNGYNLVKYCFILQLTRITQPATMGVMHKPGKPVYITV